MDLNVQVISVEMNVEISKRDGGTYPGSRLTYRDKGKVSEQAFHNKFLSNNAHLANALKELKAGDNIIISKIKDDQTGYWTVTEIKKSDGVQANVATTTTAAPKGNYETAVERAARQVMIVRQSSLSTAVALSAANGGKKSSPADVIAIAKEFEAYVMGTEFDNGTIDTIPNSEID